MTWFHLEPHYFACFTRPFGEGKGEKHREGHVESHVSTEEDLVDLNKKLVHCGSPSLLLGPCPLVVLPAPPMSCSRLLSADSSTSRQSVYHKGEERDLYFITATTLCYLVWQAVSNTPPNDPHFVILMPCAIPFS